MHLIKPATGSFVIKTIHLAMKPLLLLLILACMAYGCKKDNAPEPTPTPAGMYFPPTGSNTWETAAPESLGWKTANLPALKSYLEAGDTRAFILLKNGRIVVEWYFGTQPTGGAFNANSIWYWASAGKTLTATLVGIARQKGYLTLGQKTSDLLGEKWTSLSFLQESQITIHSQLTMISGLDDGVADPYCTLPSCLVYKAPAGTRWAYHNAPYTLLDQVIAKATAQNFSTFFNANLRDRIGMDGAWIKQDYNNVYYSTPRSMARFGLLALNKFVWNGTPIVNDEAYCTAMVNTSQDLNKSYGFLWWLNGKGSFMAPGSQIVFPLNLCPNAPADMFAAMGKNGQIINVVPSQGLVLIRMGDNPDNAPVPVTFQNEMWARLKDVLP
jgi:CubicO group peptidase (beta-lactamase class C family)